MKSSQLISLNTAFGEISSGQRYKIAVCNWMILKRQKGRGISVGKRYGRADGVEVNIGGLGERETFDNKLSDPLTRELFLNKAKELNLDIDFTIRFRKEFLRVTKEIVMEANLFKSA